MRRGESTTPLTQRRMLLCMGPGGVGKTTCAAALASAAAAAGRKVAVLTVDPSQRLAQALGFASPADLGHVPVEIEVGAQGRLWAAGLDRVRVFDDIVERCADPATAQRLRSHPIYRATAEQLGGALEYASMARVQMLAEENRFDLIVVDTPPAANALDFLRAPDRVRQLIENPAARLLSTGAKISARGTRFSTRVAGLGSGLVTRTLERIAGSGFLGHLSGFLSTFAGVIDEFHQRGTEFSASLRSPTTGALLVTSPAPFSIREANGFLVAMIEERIRVDGVILNRIDPSSGLDIEVATGTDLRARLAATARAAAEQSRAALAGLARAHPDLPIFRVPRAEVGPTDIASLTQLGRGLWAEGAGQR